MANYWVHNGFLQVEGEKMAKSLGNFVTIHELLKDWPGEVLRFQMLMTHYRQPLDWARKRTEEAAVALDSFRHFTTAVDGGELSPRVLAALEDDLNTPQVIMELHRLADDARTGDWRSACQLKETCAFLGFELKTNLQEVLKLQRGGVNEIEINALIDDRAAARARKDWAESDRIRDELAKMGVVVKDTKDGTTWEVAR
jgi:cysteinyl-tRNA synthetase